MPLSICNFCCRHFIVTDSHVFFCSVHRISDYFGWFFVQPKPWNELIMCGILNLLHSASETLVCLDFKKKKHPTRRQTTHRFHPVGSRYSKLASLMNFFQICWSFYLNTCSRIAAQQKWFQAILTSREVERTSHFNRKLNFNSSVQLNLYNIIIFRCRQSNENTVSTKDSFPPNLHIIVSMQTISFAVQQIELLRYRSSDIMIPRNCSQYFYFRRSHCVKMHLKMLVPRNFPFVRSLFAVHLFMRFFFIVVLFCVQAFMVQNGNCRFSVTCPITIGLNIRR